MKIAKYKSGFTLIELLIVIAIIGILAVIIITIMSITIKRKANDAKEIVHIEQVAKALDVYYESEGHYDPGVHHNCPSDCNTDPPYADLGWSCQWDGGTVCMDCSESFITDLFSGLQDKGFVDSGGIQDMFGTDFNEPDFQMCYFYSMDGQRYKLVSRLHFNSKMQKDGGVRSDFYEVGNDMDMTFYYSYCPYENIPGVCPP